MRVANTQPVRRFGSRICRPDGPLRAGGISTLAVVMGAELCIAFVILSTALLVMVAPHP
jgi:hypothetical protein